jgi:Prenyltransferase and squalene oxidase repeat
MSWQIGAFGLLAVALLGGFIWYERTRPDARIVALVGTLAAFAALGRIAFAAVPNVKPTTDIVLISGYALGGGPGFAVGALAGLTSNFFFGQGPWTPWQMAGWGATGVIGAGLAWLVALRYRGRPGVIGRWPLAVTCCVVGFAFTAFQDVGDWVTYSDHSLGALGLYVGQGLGFDAIHAAGCVVFALAIGPALIRSIQRFAARLQVTWVGPESGGGTAGGAARPPAAHLRWAEARQETHAGRASLAEVRGRRRLAGAALVTVAALAVGTQHAHANPTATGAATSYLLSAQNADGGFGEAPGQSSDPLYTGWAALGLAAAGRDLNLVSRGNGRLMSYVQAHARTTGDVGALERTILVVGAAGRSARSFAGHDLVAALERRIRGDGSVSQQVNLTAFAVLALRSAGVSGGAVTRGQHWLAAQQDRDGGFNFATAGGTSDVDDTGAALEALAGDGAAGGARTRAVAFLRRQQDRDGGFPSQPGTGSNAQSTAWAIQGLEAAGVSPASFHRGGAPSPLAYLISLTGSNGLVRYSRGMTQTPVWVTGEALMAMAGKPLPVAAPPARSVPAAATPHRASRTATASRRAKAARPPAKPAAPRVAARRAGTAPAPPSIQRLVGTAGVITALLLAPVGAG